MPQIVNNLRGKKVVEISAGSEHSAALTSDGGLYCWGSNAKGQCGLGKGVPFMTVLTPKFVASFLGVSIKRVSCGARFTAAVTAEGKFGLGGRPVWTTRLWTTHEKNDTTASSAKVTFKRQ